MLKYTLSCDLGALCQSATWEVGHTQSVSSSVLQIRFQPDKAQVRLTGLGFNTINPMVLSITPTRELINRVFWLWPTSQVANLTCDFKPLGDFIARESLQIIEFRAAYHLISARRDLIRRIGLSL